MVKLFTIIIFLFIGIGCNNLNRSNLPIKLKLENNTSNNIYDIKIYYYNGKIDIPKVLAKNSYTCSFIPDGDSSLKIEYKFEKNKIKKDFEIYFSRGMSGKIIIRIKSMKQIEIEDNLSIN
jgi:hypothetical protein